MRMLAAGSLLIIGLLLGPASTTVAQSTAPRVEVTLHASVESVTPGEPFTTALKFDVPDGFHLYWENPGESGMAPVVAWALPAGFTAGPLRFPVPTEHESGGIVTHVLDGVVVLLTQITPPQDLAIGPPITLSADVVWLVCKQACFRQNATVRIELPTTAEAKPVSDESEALLFKAAERKLPVPPGAGKFAAVSAKVSQDTIAVGDRLDLTLAVDVKSGYHIQSDKPLGEFFIPSAVFIRTIEGLAFGRPQWPQAQVRTDKTLGKVSEFTGDVQVRIPVRVEAPTVAKDLTISGIFKYQACDDRGRCFPPEAIEWSVPLASTTVRAAGEPATSPPPTAGAMDARIAPPDHLDEIAAPDETISEGGFSGLLARAGLLGALVGGFLGGLILNIMPCVLPVISIKILSFVQQAKESPRRVFQLGLTFSAGIIVSFWALAAGILVLQHVTQQTRGWGTFFQEPAFVVGMIVVMFVFALNLFGAFEIMLPGAAAGKLAGAADREGFTGAYLKGVLATLLATPCTAPFLASAVSFALAASPVVVFVIFTSAGVGMASPYVLLTARPAWMKYVPKPGPWMVNFKQFMGFLLIGTAVWLLWILGKLRGESGVIAVIVLLTFLGLACWLYGRIGFAWSTGKKLLTYVAALGVAVLGAWFGYGVQAGVPTVEWVAYEAGLPEKLAAEGRTVYVDYTAAWCLTCQANKSLVFGNGNVLRKLDALGVVPVKADFTNYDPVMAEDLRRFNRDAVPLNVIYPADKPDRPIVLPVVLTPGIVLKALEKAGPSRTHSPVTVAAEH